MNEGDKILLIIEDDPKFAKFVYDYAHKKAFKCLIAPDGKTGLELVKTYQPEAIILDLNLPDLSGWEVLAMLKNDPDTRHIPVHIMSVDEEVLDAYRRGAMGYQTKPINQEGLAESFQKIEHFSAREIKTLLLVEDDVRLASTEYAMKFELKRPEYDKAMRILQVVLAKMPEESVAYNQKVSNWIAKAQEKFNEYSPENFVRKVEAAKARHSSDQNKSGTKGL